MLVYPNGNVKGIWSGEYNICDDTHCLIIAANFIGNVDASKQFIEKEHGIKDPNKLYFITRGTYSVYERQTSTGQGRNVYGFIYVRGWLYPNEIAIGEIFLTEKKKDFETFDWSAWPIN